MARVRISRPEKLFEESTLVMLLFGEIACVMEDGSFRGCGVNRDSEPTQQMAVKDSGDNHRDAC